MASRSRIARFEAFEFDFNKGVLRRDGEVVRLRRQTAALLSVLLQHAGDLVTQDQIIEALWPDRTVDYEQGIHNVVRNLRKSLDDDPRDPRYIETLHGQGYTFLVPVQIGSREDGNGVAAPAAAEQPRRPDPVPRWRRLLAEWLVGEDASRERAS